MEKLMRKSNDFISPGFKCYKLTVIEKGKSTKAGIYWKCLCECGDICEISAARLNEKNLKVAKSCSKCKYKSWSKGTKNVSGTYFGKIKNHAKHRKIEFNISIDYMQKLWNDQSGKCKLSGVDLTYKLGKNHMGQTCSLDRIDSSKGYIEGNVQWVHKIVNFMKTTLQNEDFIDWCRKIVDFNSSILKCNDVD